VDTDLIRASDLKEARKEALRQLKETYSGEKGWRDYVDWSVKPATKSDIEYWNNAHGLVGHKKLELNPGAAWHRKESDRNEKNDRPYTKYFTMAHDISARESEKLGMPNPLTKSGLGKLIVPAIIIGLIWWLSKRNSV